MELASDNDASRPRANSKQQKDAKQRRWQVKQAKIAQQNAKTDSRETWIRNNAHYCTKVTLDDVQRIKTDAQDSVLASLLRPYIDLKDAPNQVDSSSQETMFIAEGTETVRLLIQQTAKETQALTVKSVFCKPATLFDPPVQLLTDIEHVSSSTTKKRPRNDEQLERVGPPFHVLVGAEDAMSAVAGFHISRGALACGVVPKRDETWLHDYISQQCRISKPLRLLAMDGISDSANMGSMIRCAAAFGISAIVLSSDCCDAWYRRSVRVSMGYIFQVPVVHVDDLGSTLQHLAKSASVVSYAAVIDANAELVLEDMHRGEVSRSWCCVMGNEGNGISQAVVQACNHRLRIGMSAGVDSLSVPIATGILLHGLVERETSDN